MVRSIIGNGRRLFLLLAVVLCFPGGSGVLVLADEMPSWTPAVNLSDRPGRSFLATLVSDPATGDLWAIWTDDGVAEQEEVLGRRWVRSARTWLPVENLSQSEPWQRDGGAVLVFDGQGSGLLIWTRTYGVSQGAPASGHDVLWRLWNGSSWSSEAVLFHDSAYLPGSPGHFGLIPVQTADGILLFVTWGTGYRTARFQNGAWSAVTPWAFLPVALEQVIPDPEDAGLLHAAALGPNSNGTGYNAYFYDAYYLTFNGLDWSDALNLSSTTSVADEVGLAFDWQGRLHFLWSDPDSPFSDESQLSTIWERVMEDGTWSITNTQVISYNPGQGVDGFWLTASPTGTLHLAWSEGVFSDGAHTELDIYYRSGDGTTWGSEEKVFSSVAASRYPVLALGADGPALVWQEEFESGGTLLEEEVYFSQEIGALPRHYAVSLPVIYKSMQ